MAEKAEYKGDLKRLREAMRVGRKGLADFRRQRTELIEQYVGQHYGGEAGSGDRVPTNLLEMYINIMLSQLAANSPQVLVTSENVELKPEALDLEVGLNHRFGEIELGDTLRDAVMDALFCVGVVRVGLELENADVEIDGNQHQVTRPYVRTVDIDDLVLDMSAHRFGEVEFIGNRYVLPLEVVKKFEMYDSTVTANLKPMERREYDEDGEPRLEILADDGAYQKEEEYQDHTELLDVWLPQEGQVLTLPYQPLQDDRPLRVVDWAGPDNGPYRWLSFEDVPQNIMPIAPVATGLDLHLLANKLLVKAGRQAVRQKDILTFSGPSQDDAERILKSDDGEVIRIDRQGEVGQMKFGGTDPTTLNMYMQARKDFTYMMGNLDVLGGLSAQSETLGQDKLLAENASQRVKAMQDRSMAFTRGIVEDLAWYTLEDPVWSPELTREIPGTGLRVPIVVRMDHRKGNYLDYNFDIQPYSMQQKSPAQQLQTLAQFFQMFVLPFAQQLEANGITIDFEALLRTVAKLSGLKELENLLVFSGPSPEIGEGEKAREKPPFTHRTNERISRPGATRQGQDDVIQRLLLGAKSQPAEMAAAGVA